MTASLETPTSLVSRDPRTLLLLGEEVERVSPAALTRWSQIVLLEDDSARAVRRAAAGVAERAPRVLLRVHRIDSTGISVAAEESYIPGARNLDARHRCDLALELLDQASLTGAVVVCGPAYGCRSPFVSGLSARGVDTVVEIRPSTRVAIESRNGAPAGMPVRNLLDRAQWRRLAVPVAGATGRSVNYAATRLGAGRVGSGVAGLLFAAQTGGIDGVHRGTVFGFSTAEATLEELIEAVGWARWIRPLVRRIERSATADDAVHADRPLPAVNGARPRLRANIKLSRIHDKADAAVRSVTQEAPPLKGAVASGSSAVNVVELFAGAGGMGLGFLLAQSRLARYRLLYAGEVDPIYVDTLRSNHAILDGIVRGSRRTPATVDPVDLRSTSAMQDVERRVQEGGGAHVLVGGPPCQGFSNANRNSWRSSNPHNQLIDVFLSYVVHLTPRVFLLENVQGIHWTQKGGSPEARSSVLDHIRTRMAAAGYQMFVQLLDAVWYGVPQYRSRFFVLGIHRDLGYDPADFGSWGAFPTPSHGPGTWRPFVTVRDAIGDLPRIDNGHKVERTSYVAPPDAQSAASFLALMRAGAEPGAVTDHVTSKHADYVLERYRKIPPGGNWESIAETLTNYSNVSRTHSNIYRRLTWDQPSITIGHYRKSMLVHPSQDRGLSLREAARLQSFPDWFRFAGTPRGARGGLVHKQQQLANAVCPLVTKAIAEFILQL